jgi:hypothetical protein
VCNDKFPLQEPACPFVSALLLVFAGDAYAQRIPLIFIWVAGTGLIAPFVAIAVKFGIIRLLHLEAAISRLWILCAAEWVIWFPVAFIALRSGGMMDVPLVLPVLLALMVWVHKASIANISWRSALLVSVPTPLLAIGLPFVTLGLVALFEQYLPNSVL